MSLILDALNRAEHERKNQNTVPDLTSLHLSQDLKASPYGNKILWWGVGLVLVLIAIIVALVVLLRQGPAAQQSQVNIPPVQQSFALPSSASAPLVAATSAVNATPAKATQAVVKKAPEVAAPNADVNRLYSAQDSEPSASTDTGVNELYAAEAATAAASESIVDPFNPSGSVEIATAAIQEQGPQRTFDSIKNIPDFNALPWSMRQQIPTISYARHNYLANGISSVVINNQTSGVGNIIGSGQFIVQDIFVDGVVLKHGNAVFKLRALTGWINM